MVTRLISGERVRVVVWVDCMKFFVCWEYMWFGYGGAFLCIMIEFINFFNVYCSISIFFRGFRSMLGML